VYGVVSYAAGLRHREFGIRLALGAEPRAVHRLVLREGWMLALVGLGLGSVLSVFVAAELRDQLFGVLPWDPMACGAALLGLFTTVLAACWLPARRATRVSPLEALRAE
jgi:ABC-type antimicrobial peptide transport system permease subunit